MARTPEQTVALASFHGVAFTAPLAEVIEGLTRLARADGGEATVSISDEPFSDDLHVDGPVWSYHFFSSGSRIAQVRKHPAGQDASLAWIATRIAAYGLPDIVGFGPVQSSGAELVWYAPDRIVSVTLRSDDGAWDVREDHQKCSCPPVPPTVDQRDYRDRLAHLRDRLLQLPRDEFAAGIDAWTRERAAMLDHLAPQIVGVGVRDGFRSLDTTTWMFGLCDRLPAIDGAYIVVHDPAAHGVYNRLWRFQDACGLKAVNLTWVRQIDDPFFDLEIPPMPDIHVLWLPGPFAEHLLRHVALPAVAPGVRCEILPTTFATVPDAVEEWLPMPDLENYNGKFGVLLRMLRPLRLIHPPTGTAVYLNGGDTRDDTRKHAHSLLAALLARRGST